MKQDTLLSILFGCLLALAPLNIEAQQKLKGYPPVDVAPPANPKFTALVDLTKIPKAPVRKAPSQPCDGNADPFCYWSCTLCLRDTDIGTCPKAKDWGITYDDGPSTFTPAILDHLKAKNVKATFFVIGSRVSEHPEITKRAFDEGHQIGIHTWSHTPLTTQSNEVVIAELQWTAKAIEEATGKKPVIMRPPQGDHDDRIRFIANKLGYKVVIWDKDPNDWMVSEKLNYDVSWIAGNFSQWVKEPPSKTGHISLEHDMFQKSAAKAPEAIDIVMGAGFNIKTVADCVGQPAFDGDTTNNNTTVPSASAAVPPASAAAPPASTAAVSSASAAVVPAASTPAASTPAASKKAASTTSINNYQYSSSPTPSTSPSPSPSSANLLTVNSFIGLSITVVITIVSYSLNF